MSSIDLDKRKDGPTVEHDEDAIPGLHYQTVDPHADPDAISYGPNGVKGLFFSKYVFGAATLASLGGFSMGYDMGVISIINVMEPFHKAFPKAETSFGKGLMTGMLLLGAFIGCIFMSYLSDRISRKWAITTMVVAFDIGAILQTAAVNYDMLVAGRFIGGRTTLHLRSLSSEYARHTPSPRIHLHLRRRSNSYWITFGTRHMAGEACFRLPFGLQMVSATALGLGIHFFPYSPRWLALVNRDAECLTSLTKLRNLPATDERVQIEYNSIISEVRFQKIVQERKHPGAKGLKLEILSWFDLFSKGTWRRTAVGCGIAFFQQFSGINAFIYYAPTLFESLGQSSEMSLILSGVFNVLQLVAAVICFLLIEKIGRRPLAIGGAFGMAAAYVIIAVLSGVYSKDWQANMAAGWACVAMAFVFILLYGVSYSPLGWALPSEVFSTTSRSKGVALSTCVIWLSDFIIGLITPSMLAEIEYRTYIFFAVMCFVAGIWAFLLVPETSGKSLEEIDELFGDDSAKKEREIAAAALGSSPERSVMTV
ncbi:MFS monosaccharide transporter [Aspergillus nomiae NRRL 13137]|uniref:MFS monosaccharide transporter n=1 Tax=Aspergillus nomiae NRRL (strain ATCC 15546 / NRRL 13137 / CBS 260.88 / M93) TaxID=1509407 RepID=A0A0L1JCX7_ASPN3|nr:MFS monosaccharide transporter [Aspergillus nomiae NRRL 13137]KNG89567.1 MFS monosaccharide transporter [Aspergillus nomiae NRRL 13137]